MTRLEGTPALSSKRQQVIDDPGRSRAVYALLAGAEALARSGTLRLLLKMMRPRAAEPIGDRRPASWGQGIKIRISFHGICRARVALARYNRQMGICGRIRRMRTAQTLMPRKEELGVRPVHPRFCWNAFAKSAVLVAGVSVLAACTSSSSSSSPAATSNPNGPITIGASLSLTGYFSADGQAFEKGL